MFAINAAIAAGAALIIAGSAPAFTHEQSLTLRPMLVGDIGHDVEAISAARHTDAKIVTAAVADLPAFEAIAKVGGTTEIEVELDAQGTLTGAAVRTSSGRDRLDRSALRAVRASTFQAATIDGRAVGGRYVVEVELEPSF